MCRRDCMPACTDASVGGWRRSRGRGGTSSDDRLLARASAASEAEFNSVGELQTYFIVIAIGAFASAMHRAISITQGNRTMMKNLVLAASVLMLLPISGQVFAKSVAPSDQPAVYAFNGFDEPVATEMNATTAYRYHGGPKSND